MMLASAVLLSMVGLVAADMVRFESNTSPIGDLKALSLRASVECDVGTPCGDYCIDTGAQCCSQSEGTYCRIGYACQRDGCCPLGITCVGPPSDRCEGDRIKCGKSCVPGGSQCCSQTTGIFCDPGSSCVGTTSCNGPQGSGSGTTTSGSVATSPTTSNTFGGVPTTQGSSATSTSSLPPSTKTTDSGSSSGSGSMSSSATGSASGSGSGHSTTTASSASHTDDKKNPPPSPTGAGAINSPSILLGLLAAVLLFL